jgi:hypothetical protein
MTTEEEMEVPISFWGYKEQESNLILPEHDDDNDDDDDDQWNVRFEGDLCYMGLVNKLSVITCHHIT